MDNFIFMRGGNQPITTTSLDSYSGYEKKWFLTALTTEVFTQSRADPAKYLFDSNSVIRAFNPLVSVA